MSECLASIRLLDAVNVALICSPAKISHLPPRCIVSLLMSKFVHCIHGHTSLDYTYPSPCYVIWFISACFHSVIYLFFLLLSHCSAIRIMNLRSSKTKLEGAPLPTMPSFIYSPILTNPHPNPSSCLSESLPWFTVWCSVMLKAALAWTRRSHLRYT